MKRFLRRLFARHTWMAWVAIAVELAILAEQDSLITFEED